MKGTKYIGFSLVSVMLLGGASVALAAETPKPVLNQEDNTPTTIVLEDDDDSKNPFDPEKEQTKPRLKLEKVPTKYDFETTVESPDYDLTALMEDQSIDVFNSGSKRDWHVVATVVNNKIALKTDAAVTFDVTSFKVNDTELASTGATGIVSQAEVNKTIENNTGNIIKPVTEVGIKFSDGGKVLKVGNELSGTIHYQLFNTPMSS